VSEARYRRLFEDSPIGIFFLGARGEITLANQRYRDFLGMSDAEIQSAVRWGLCIRMIGNRRWC
jgi:PAS domain S-box-containing protein